MEYLDEPGPHGFFSRLARVGLLLEAFQARCFDPFGLRFIDYSVLRVLQNAGAPYRATAGELSEIVLRSSGGMTQILDRLAQLGLVERVTDPSDRRKVLAALTDKGLDTVQRASASYVKERKRVLKSLAPEEVEKVDDAVRVLLAVLSDADADAGA